MYRMLKRLCTYAIFLQDVIFKISAFYQHLESRVTLKIINLQRRRILRGN